MREVPRAGDPGLNRFELEDRLADPQLGADELATIVRGLEQDLAAVASEPSESSRGYAKCQLADLLGKAALRSEAALALLVTLVGDRDGYEADSYAGWWEYAGDHAREALWKVGERAVPVLVAALADGRRRDAVLDVLRAMGTRAKAAAPAIEPLVRDHDPRVAVAAGYALGSLLADDPGITARCAALLDDPATRHAGMAATAPLDWRAYSELLDRFVALLHDPDDGLRYLAANRLRALGPLAARAEPALTTLLSDPFDKVKNEAAEALRALRRT